MMVRRHVQSENANREQSMEKRETDSDITRKKGGKEGRDNNRTEYVLLLVCE